MQRWVAAALRPLGEAVDPVPVGERRDLSLACALLAVSKVQRQIVLVEEVGGIGWKEVEAAPRMHDDLLGLSWRHETAGEPGLAIDVEHGLRRARPRDSEGDDLLDRDRQLWLRFQAAAQDETSKWSER
jgi:hypothetical protein